MKKLLLLSLFLSTTCYTTPIKGITETGDEVLLKDDGTWCYLNSKVTQVEKIKTNPTKFTRPPMSTFPVKSTKNKSEVWIDAKKWSFKKSKNGATEYTFSFKEGDLYGMIINESIGMELEGLTEVAFENAKKVAADTKIIQKEYRYVNGKKVIFMQMEGTISGLKFTYFGYYFSNDSGMTQLIAYTGTSAVKRYKSEMEDFLNGFMVRD